MSFSLQRLCMVFEDFKSIKNNFDTAKYNFCIDFEKEYDIPGKYSEDIFDFLYNIYDYKKVFKDNDFKKLRSDFLDLNFKNFIVVNRFINDVYQEIVLLSKTHFYEFFKLKGSNDKELAEDFGRNLQTNIEKFVAHF